MCRSIKKRKTKTERNHSVCLVNNQVVKSSYSFSHINKVCEPVKQNMSAGSFYLLRKTDVKSLKIFIELSLPLLCCYHCSGFSSDLGSPTESPERQMSLENYSHVLVSSNVPPHQAGAWVTEHMTGKQAEHMQQSIHIDRILNVLGLFAAILSKCEFIS